MEFVELYVGEVGRRLPEKTRQDIEQEIRSMIEDMLADESKKLGRPVDDEMVVAVLKRLGSPEKMAASYLPPRYLIGPDLYPTFILVTRVVMTVILVIGVIGLGISLGVSNLIATQIGQKVFQAAGDLINSVLAAFGWIVITFAAIQWVIKEKNIKVKQLEWEPSKLKNVRTGKEEKFNPAGLVTEIVFTVIALVLFNAFPQYLGVGALRDGQWIIVSLLAPAFFTYLPWITLLWALKAAVDIAALAQGRWMIWMHWLLIALGLGSIVLGYRMLTGPDLVAFPPDTAVRLGWGTITNLTMQDLSTIVNGVVRLVVGVALVIQIIDVTVHLFRLLLKGIRPAVICLQN